MKPTVPVVGKMQAGGVAEMQSSTFTLHYVMAEREWDETLSAPTRARAIDLAGRDAKLVFAREKPVSGYCAVFDGEGEDAEPLGCWDYDPQTGELVWAPEE